MSNPIFPYGVSSYIGLIFIWGQWRQWRPLVHYGDNLIHQLILPEAFNFDSFGGGTVGSAVACKDGPDAVAGEQATKRKVDDVERGRKRSC
ncbi:hypothetical protein K503DRAFT_769800 [Rhizopogon vinicolor AM-OR11-026]|uniref:Uncharacterized protein n=1 Tax=Rhizopogon vinicolor AM-OR11-026 TaxID=1314800 RepID=A0A1B7N2R5_9AGAM|nr:hypothetical protein K503DRAFT_769800 [Rhizopogon vinicolor AM-OR11-026]